MIDKELFFKKHRELQPEFLEKITETTMTEFPKRFEELKTHLVNLNYGETMYYSDFIEDSFIFIFGDVEFGKLLRRVNKAAKENNKEGLLGLYPLLTSNADRFVQEIREFHLEHFSNKK